ncbi:MAG: NADH-quinone oxidoreductase subunit J [Candidatus Omnitrophica bacterium]|nr:NADH-quinone oxidoreductase subunit J [Candidatus Omnitrophota bacterium]
MFSIIGSHNFVIFFTTSGPHVEACFFYLFTTVMLVAAIGAVALRSPIYSLLSLLVSMFAVAALFVLLHAFFVAALQVLLYAGAILVLFLFVIMLLNLNQQELSRTRQHTLLVLGVGAGLVLLSVLVPILRLTAAAPAPDTPGTITAIGRLLFTQYLLPFEVTSLLLLAAIVGAVVLAKRRIDT